MFGNIGTLTAVGLLVAAMPVVGQASYRSIPYDELPMMGSPDAPVRIVEFADFKCPHCKTFTLEIFPQIKEEFIDTGVVSFYYMNFPVIARDSVTAGEVAAAVHDLYGIDAFWDLQKEVFRNQGDPRETWATVEYLTSIAEAVVDGLNRDELAAAVEDNTYQYEVRRDFLVGDEIGVSGTPTVIVGDTVVQDYRDYGRIRQLINEQK